MNETDMDLYSWLASEHARLHAVTAWPESDRKKALLVSIQSSIRRLMAVDAAAHFKCMMCQAGMKSVTIRSTAQRRTGVSPLQELAA